MILPLRTLSIVLLLLAAACDHRELNTADLSANSDLPDKDGGGCPSIGVGTAPSITPTVVIGTAPAAAGGTIVIGTYFLTADTVYLSDADMGQQTPMLQGVITLSSGNEFAEVEKALGATSTGSGTYGVSGTQIMFTSCSDQAVSSRSYTATATMLTLFESTNTGLTGQSVYTKQ